MAEASEGDEFFAWFLESPLTRGGFLLMAVLVIIGLMTAFLSGGF